LPFKLSGSIVCSKTFSSTFQGSSQIIQDTYALSSSHASSHCSPACVKVMRLPVPTLLSGYPLISARSMPNVRLSVEPSALPAKCVLSRILKFDLLFGLVFLSGDMPTYNKVYS